MIEIKKKQEIEILFLFNSDILNIIIETSIYISFILFDLYYFILFSLIYLYVFSDL